MKKLLVVVAILAVMAQTAQAMNTGSAQSSCKARGGNWVFGFNGNGYCCPRGVICD